MGLWQQDPSWHIEEVRMKFYPTPIIRYCYRYIATVVFVILPMYFALVMPFDTSVIKVEDRGAFILLNAAAWFFA